MAIKPTIEELKALIKEEDLKIVVRKGTAVEEVLAMIEEKRAEKEDEGDQETEDEDEGSEEGATVETEPEYTSNEPQRSNRGEKPSCIGNFVKEGHPTCRRCWSAQECKLV